MVSPFCFPALNLTWQFWYTFWLPLYNHPWVKKTTSYSLSQLCKRTGLRWVVLWSLSCGCSQMTGRAAVIGSPCWAAWDGLFTHMPGTWRWPLTESSAEVSTRVPTQGVFMWLGLLMGEWPRAVTFLTCSLASEGEHPKMSIPGNLGGSYNFSCNLNPRSCSISSLVSLDQKQPTQTAQIKRGGDYSWEVHSRTNSDT